MRLRAPTALLVTMLGLLLIGCGDDATLEEGRSGDGVLAGEVLFEGLTGPTQLVVGPDGWWWVAQLNGGENDQQGQIVRIDPDRPDDEPVVVLDGLDKPTGLALFADEVWVMEADRLTRGPLDGSERVDVAADLVNNGRSEGSLTIDGERLLYDTSGRLADDDGTVAEGSGTLWAVTMNGGEPTIEPVATGFKHAYAQARTDDGVLYTTEIGDGRYDGEPADDEVVAVEPGVDGGWPRCVGDNLPVVEYGGDDEICATAPRSTAVLAKGATPTSLVVAPWDRSQLLVALWNRAEVVAVPVGSADTDLPATPVVVYTDAQHPQHLTVDGERVLLTDHTAGTIIALTP